MAKLSIIIPMVHPSPPHEGMSAMWVRVFGTNDPELFAREMEFYLLQAIPLRVEVKHLTSGEAEYLKNLLVNMHEGVNKKLIQSGLPVIATNFREQVQKVIDGGTQQKSKTADRSQ